MINIKSEHGNLTANCTLYTTKTWHVYK